MRYFVFWNKTLNRFDAVKSSNRDRAGKLIKKYYTDYQVCDKNRRLICPIDLSFKFAQSEFPYRLNPFCLPVSFGYQYDLEQQIKYPESL